MQRGHGAARHRPEQRHLELVDMEMNDLELTPVRQLTEEIQLVGIDRI